MRVTAMAVTLVALCVRAAFYVPCCRRYMPGIFQFSDIKGFSVQKHTDLCRVNAIIFHTKKGRRCVDPALDWVVDYVSRIEYMAQKVHQRAKTHTSDYVKQGGFCSNVAPKGHQKANPQPKQSLASGPDKSITDVPKPEKLCKW